MFDIAKWNSLGFHFKRDNVEYSKDIDSDGLMVDNCDHEICEDDPISHEIPILIMWLIEVGAIEPIYS